MAKSFECYRGGRGALDPSSSFGCGARDHVPTGIQSAVFPFQRRIVPSLQVLTLHTGDVFPETFIDAPNVKSLKIVCDNWSDLTGLTADILRSLTMFSIHPGTHRTLTPARFSGLMSGIYIRYLNWTGYALQILGNIYGNNAQLASLAFH
ncbi:hypothetical protein M422DRAFT_252998 [Sphaerobolus stellatus SS14]|uniref:Uncharacterized protein n=1 Tax=Sphaerobolus stellatus (strain SS14) TaxID=990650 RepID=A0A0C9VYZ3_SPHS4|nr:hypothetical protein M422DRAFT_252998 [Sphaerobolus stellatus SS14]